MAHSCRRNEIFPAPFLVSVNFLTHCDTKSRPNTECVCPTFPWRLRLDFWPYMIPQSPNSTPSGIFLTSTGAKPVRVLGGWFRRGVSDHAPVILLQFNREFMAHPCHRNEMLLALFQFLTRCESCDTKSRPNTECVRLCLSLPTFTWRLGLDFQPASAAVVIILLGQ